MLVYLIVSQALFIFPYSSFSVFFNLHNLYQFIFKFTDSSANSNLLLSHSIEFLILLICNSQLQNFHLVTFNNFCLFVNIFNLMRHCQFIFLCFKHVSLSSLNVECWPLNVWNIMAALKSLFSLTSISPHRQSLLPAFKTKQRMGHTCLFLCMSHNFCWKLDILGNIL